METFTLVAWLWMGQRFEETRIENMSRPECGERAIAILADREKAKPQCINRKGHVVFPTIRQFPSCAEAACGWPLPGRRWV
jgi:hypothetical protein